MHRAPNVLIVEDSYILLDIIASLCENRGIRVVEASSGEAALTILRARAGEIDCLFTDIHLPGLIDGWTVAASFRSLHADRPVVYTSADTTARHRCVPGSLFLRKPFQVREVDAMVRTMAEGLGTRPEAELLWAAG